MTLSSMWKTQRSQRCFQFAKHFAELQRISTCSIVKTLVDNLQFLSPVLLQANASKRFKVFPDVTFNILSSILNASPVQENTI